MKTWKLSPFEKTCLRWVARGRTIEEIASLEGKSRPEIEYYIKRALVLLEATSIKDALEKANCHVAIKRENAAVSAGFGI